MADALDLDRQVAGKPAITDWIKGEFSEPG